VPKGCLQVRKGRKSSVEAYSAFFDHLRREETLLLATLLDAGVTDVFVCGLATDVCVGKTIEAATGERSLICMWKFYVLTFFLLTSDDYFKDNVSIH